LKYTANRILSGKNNNIFSRGLLRKTLKLFKSNTFVANSNEKERKEESSGKTRKKVL
jgi:hypothetical protein